MKRIKEPEVFISDGVYVEIRITSYPTLKGYYATNPIKSELVSFIAKDESEVKELSKKVLPSVHERIVNSVGKDAEGCEIYSFEKMEKIIFQRKNN